jgi:hypothetical protein
VKPKTLHRKCSREGCEKTYPVHRWGAIRAGADGWFLQRNGDAWCPEHHPEWVAEWRTRQ